MPLPLVWVQKISDPDKRKEFESLVRNSTTVLGRLLEIVDDRIAHLDNTVTTQNDFDTPNWDYRQAFRNGQRSAFKYIKDLLNLDPNIIIRPE